MICRDSASAVASTGAVRLPLDASLDADTLCLDCSTLVFTDDGVLIRCSGWCTGTPPE